MSPSAPSPRSIGSMNGKWAVMFKLSLALFPVVCGVLSGSVKYVYDHELRIRYIEATRFTPEDIKVVKKQLEHATIDVSSLENRIGRVETKIDRMIELQLQQAMNRKESP